MDLVLQTCSDVDDALTLNRWLTRPVVRRVTIGLPEVPRIERARVARRLRRLFNDCGCIVGAPVFLFSLFGLAWMPRAPTGFEAIALTWVIPTSAGLAVAAKLAALRWSHRALRGALLALRRTASAPGEGSTR